MMRRVIISADFVDQLKVVVPEAHNIVVEHFADNDELLLHLLMSDLLRFAVSTFSDGHTDITDRLLAFVDRSLRDGDEDVVNAVCVSFVEGFGAYPGESDALLERWSSALRTELGR